MTILIAIICVPVIFSIIYFILKLRFNNSIHKANNALLDNTIKKHKLTQMEVEILSVISAFHPHTFDQIAAAYRKCLYFDVLLAALHQSAEQNVTLGSYIETVILRQEEVEASPVWH